jgi:hypothetical protein
MRSHPPRPRDVAALEMLRAALSAPLERDRDPVRFSLFVDLDGSTEMITADRKHSARWKPKGAIVFSAEAPEAFRDCAQRIRTNQG